MSANLDPFPVKALPFLLKYIKLRKWHVFMSFALILTGVSISNLGNWFFAQIIEAVKGGVSEQSLSIAMKFVAFMAGCAFINIFFPKLIFVYRQKYFYLPVQKEITQDALAYIQGHSYNYIASNQTGTFINKMHQILAVQPIFSIILVSSWSVICEIVIKTAILMLINFGLGLLFLGAAVASYLFNVIINKKAERLSRMGNRIDSLYGGWLVDVIANMRFVKQFCKVNFEKNRLFVLLKQAFGIRVKEFREWLKNYTLSGIFINLCSMMIIGYAVYLWSLSKIGVGDIVFVLLTLTSGLNYLIELHDAFRNIKTRLAAMDEGLKPFAVPHEIKDLVGAKKLRVTKGVIEFKNFGFSYNCKNKIFNDFNLKIGSREKIGIVGASGAGKTTLVNLLQRAYEPQAGQIFIDGKDIAKVTAGSLHDNIAFIPQDTTLFHRSIKENIEFGNPEASENKIILASKKAYADEFIKKLPNGYESQVGDRGCKLSGGEKQRIAIARAILKNSPILILDEATSSLDSESESLISKAINNIIDGKTVIAIAHRLSTLKEMDRIVVLDKGKIVEQGSYEELINKKGGKFNYFYKLQKKNHKRGTLNEK